MNITFLIGNGFDVGLGLRSRFKDFFPIYVKQSKDKKPEIRKLSEQIGEDYETWSEFEVQMGQYTEKFDQTNKQQYPAQFRDFETEFIQYLKDEVKKLSFDDSESLSKKMCTALTGFYEKDILQDGSAKAVADVFMKNKGQEHRYHFISFNYTDTLEKCLGTIADRLVKKRVVGSTTLSDRIGNIVHVHGTCYNAPIMGVNDTSQIAKKELADDPRFIQYLVKPLLNTLHRTDRDTEGSTLITSSQIICIYGMALGETDKQWWERVLKWLEEGADRQLVIFDYDPEFNVASQFDWIDKEISIMDKLSNYITSSQVDIEILRPRIHIAVHKNIFAMNLRKQDQKKNESTIERASNNISSLGLDFNKISSLSQSAIAASSLLDRERIDQIYSSLPKELKHGP